MTTETAGLLALGIAYALCTMEKVAGFEEGQYDLRTGR